MHGKIVRYLNSNGKGVVINVSKMLFEFTKETWHDKKVIPMVGMFVEFRCNDNHQVTDCRVSKFQEFSKNSLLKESNFWHSESDEELETLEANLRDARVQQIYKNTDYDTLNAVPLTIKITEAIKKYFYQEFLAISFLNDLRFENSLVLLDFFLVKRFVFKVLDTLLFNDKTVAKDDFVEELSVITRLETSFNDITRNQNIRIEQIFENNFLLEQTHFQALKAAIENTKDTLKMYDKRIASLKSELLILTRRLQSDPKNSDFLKKQEKIKEELEFLKGEIQKLDTRYVRLDSMQRRFYEHHFQSFEYLFLKTHKMLQKKIQNGLDICATILDDKIYHKSLKSTAMKNCYFKYPENEKPPIATSFMYQYLERLNKDRLNEGDKKLYLYSQKIDRMYKKFFLVVSSDEKSALELKMQILEQNKFNCVKVASKQILFLGMVREIEFSEIYIDSMHIWESPQKLIEEIKTFKVNQNTPIKTLTNSQKVNRFGFSE
ncbi:hypothetical protein B6S12_06830 [Helicobacter valdiviensis]|uniref:Uncharacterized protein n=1 Tax=Helicobacter valdiviensis TaxID=1458358 RepID=A0A2W6MTV8_9HELI|nr:hypothetical protein [Helicobacter valdiviensis]PZT47872.1 hypothetical protein B6S12_06830 [Helicobacter valdiviensis]